MNSALHFAGAMGLAYGVAFLVWPVLRGPPFIRWCIVTAALVVTAFCGLLLPTEGSVLRAIACIFGALLAVRIYSYAQTTRRSGFADYVRFLSIGILTPDLLYSPDRRASRNNVSLGREALRIAVSITVIPLAYFAAGRLILSEWGRSSWILNHLIVIVAFVVIMQAFGQCAFGIWRIMGLRGKPIVDNVFLSRTPAEFWRRWSWPIHLWLYQYVFVPAGGRKFPVRATLAVFLLSGIMHDAMSFVWLGRATGHWTICFLLGAVGVLISPALDRLADRGIVANIAVRLVTIVFLIIMAVPAFVAIDYGLPLYYKKIWLMW